MVKKKGAKEVMMRRIHYDDGDKNADGDDDDDDRISTIDRLGVRNTHAPAKRTHNHGGRWQTVCELIDCQT